MPRTLFVIFVLLCIIILFANTKDYNNNNNNNRKLQQQQRNSSNNVIPYLYLPHCKFDENSIRNNATLYELIDKADLVFTGKVSSEINYINNVTIKFSVIIKRLFKNNNGGDNDDDFNKDDQIYVTKLLNHGEGVLCRLSLRPKYTAIFIGRRQRRQRQKQQNIKNIDDDDVITLTFSPVPVTLTNLDRVSEATKGN